jgi:outer membrane PBP1 activator LpoA protein
MALPFRLRAALFVLCLHGMGLCVAAGNEASAVAKASVIASAPEGAVQLALLLPLASPDFARPAEAVRLGFMAAHKHSGEKLTIGLIATDASGENILAGYDKAAKLGARLIIGPMTRSGVSALAASKLVSVPTIGLNQPEDKTALPPQFYTFGLALEAEAQLVARSAYADFFKSAILVSAKSALAQRSRDAFAEAWERLGGTIRAAYEFGPQTDLPALREALSTASVDMIFLAGDGEQARAVRPFLNNNIAVFATSQVNSGRNNPLANIDLNGIRFVEMPWLVQSDHPAVMVYPRPEGITAELERFYALGIDAFRIAAALLEAPRRLDLDGVTGRLTLYGNVVVREPVQAVFRNGVGVTLDHDAPGEGTR